MLTAPPWSRVPVVLLCALPAVVQGTARAQEADLAERLYQSGERAYAAKAFQEAADTWNQLLQSAPKSPFAPRALLGLARLQVEVNQRPDAAMPLLDRLKADHIQAPEAAEGLLLRGTLLAQQARRPAELKEAMAEFNRVIDLFPESPAVPEARFRLGLAWRDQGEWGRALQQFVEAFRTHPAAAVAPRAMLAAAETMDLLDDLPGCLRMLQQVRTLTPQSPEAQEASWRMAVRVKHRLQKPPFANEGAWPAGRAKWLKTPTLLATAPDGDLLIYQNDQDRAFRFHQGELGPAGPAAAGAKAMAASPAGEVWLLSRAGLSRDSAAPMPLNGLGAISGAALDRWGALWVADAKTPSLTVFSPDGTSRSVVSPTANALTALPTGGMAVASDADRKLLFLDAEGQPRVVIPYGKDLPAPFRHVVALASDGAGQVAALVDGGDFGEGVLILDPRGTVLRQATFKSLGLSGRITSLALDHSGGLILCDRRNDLLYRLN